ncbi:hypothetical protein INT44_004058 [Umbelopsis vinacea]|uniref:IucC family-domain-containing protein n=1 Tax=Umbelopsis vinacea TaxID=44442 RepID=A0A8H7UK34_9FUNG|nr:hypothetical protein INT44_004058 [Umbelopsis vinacea]
MPIPSVSRTSHFAQFATSSRLLACLVTEGLMSAYVLTYPSHLSSDVTALCIVVFEHAVRFGLKDIHSIVPLKNLPIVELSCSENGLHKVKLLDPMDMLPAIYTLCTDDVSENLLWLGQDHVNWKKTTYDLIQAQVPGMSNYELCGRIDGSKLWTSFAVTINVDKHLMSQISMELTSSIINQKYIYDHPKPLPTFQSPPIEWEQLILEGHATHPMHKARYTVPPMPVISGDEYDLSNPRIRAVAVPRASVNLRGDFEELTEPLVKALFDNSTETSLPDPNEYVLMPIHELQLPNIHHYFSNVVVLPPNISVPAKALTSLRSIVVEDVLPEHSLKLCLGMKISSALRTITPYTTYFGPGFSKNVVPKLTINKDVLQIERELASACYKHDDFNVAKHCSAVVREAFENTCAKRGEQVVVCAALVEKCQNAESNKSLVEHVWGLDTDEKKEEFLDRYIRLSLEAFLPPCLHNGVAFEAHGQNTLARFDSKTKKLIGFIVRDFGGIKGHQETLRKSCGVELDVIPDSCVEANELDEVYKLLYHTLIFGHLHRLIRVLGMHYNGKGWAMLRQHLTKMIPESHPMYTAWLRKQELPGKCLMQMKIDELYRDYIYRNIPNLILYEPQQHVLEDVPIPNGTKGGYLSSANLNSQSV